MCVSHNLMIEKFDAVDAFELAQENCSECGGLGYTLEGKNSEDGEVMVGCRLCWIRHQDANIPTLSLDMEVEQLYHAAHAADQEECSA